MSAILDALGYIGGSLDKPGRVVRGLLGGHPEELGNLIPFSDAMGITDPQNAVSGRGLLEQLGVLDKKDEGEGFTGGDLAGMGVEMATDPLNWLGGMGIKKLAGLRSGAMENNAVREAMLAKGAMPEEIAGLTKAADESGRPLRLYHGTPHVFNEYDMGKMNRGGLHGPGIYLTDNPEVASGYAEGGMKAEGASPHVRMHYLDSRQPFDVNAIHEREKIAPLLEEIIGQRKEMYPDFQHNVPVLPQPDYGGQQTWDMLARTAGHDLPLVTEAMQSKNYDSILYKGGHIMGSQPHNVHIALDPSQVYSPYIAPLERPVPPGAGPLLAALGAHNVGARGLGGLQ